LGLGFFGVGVGACVLGLGWLPCVGGWGHRGKRVMVDVSLWVRVFLFGR